MKLEIPAVAADRAEKIAPIPAKIGPSATVLRTI